MQLEFGQLTMKVVEPGNEPARQESTRTGQDEGGTFDVTLQLGTTLPQAGKCLAYAALKPLPVTREFQASACLGKQCDAEVFLQAAQLTANRTVGNTEFFRRSRHAAQPRGGLESAQGAKGRHGVQHRLVILAHM